MTNKVGVALSNLWLAADKARTNATAYDQLRQKYLDLSDLSEDVYDAQVDATNERNNINTAGSVIGCIGGGIAGFFAGGPIGAAAGCSAGSKFGNTITDWAQDASFFGDTAKERELKELEQELAEFDVQISEDAFKYGAQALQEKEDKLQMDKDKMLQDYSTWLWQDFYGNTDLDYLLDLGMQAAEFGLSKVGGDVIDEFFKGSEALSDAELDKLISEQGMSTPVSITDTGVISDFTDFQNRQIDYLQAIEELK